MFLKATDTWYNIKIMLKNKLLFNNMKNRKKKWIKLLVLLSVDSDRSEINLNKRGTKPKSFHEMKGYEYFLEQYKASSKTQCNAAITSNIAQNVGWSVCVIMPCLQRPILKQKNENQPHQQLKSRQDSLWWARNLNSRQKSVQNLWTFIGVTGITATLMTT